MFTEPNNIKLIFSILASILIIIAFVPYLRDIFNRKTKPHTYTWLIWTITQGVAFAGLLYGNGGWVILPFVVGIFFVALVFLLSIKYGTSNITKFDTVILIISLSAIIVWYKLHNPLWAVFIVSATDFLGYLPSFRKSFKEPYTETIFTWIMFCIINLLAIFSLNAYNLLTLTYIVTVTVANLILIGVCLVRRKALL